MHRFYPWGRILELARNWQPGGNMLFGYLDTNAGNGVAPKKLLSRQLMHFCPRKCHVWSLPTMLQALWMALADLTTLVFLMIIRNDCISVFDHFDVWRLLSVLISRISLFPSNRRWCISRGTQVWKQHLSYLLSPIQWYNAYCHLDAEMSFLAPDVLESTSWAVLQNIL